MGNQEIYLIVRGQGKLDETTGKMVGAFEHVGVYMNMVELKIAYQEAAKQLEEDFQEFKKDIDERSIWSKKEYYDKLFIHSYNRETNQWNYDLIPSEMFTV